MTVSELQKQRASLLDARSSGARSVTFRSGGTQRTVEYKSDSDMASAIRAIDAEIAAASGKSIHTFKPTFSKGF